MFSFNHPKDFRVSDHFFGGLRRIFLLTGLFCLTVVAQAAVNVSTLSELQEAVQINDQTIVMKPGSYKLTDLPEGSREIVCSGSNNTIDLSGVYVDAPVGTTRKRYINISGHNNTFKGGTFEDTYQSGLKEVTDFSAYNQNRTTLARGLKGDAVFGITGNDNTVVGTKLTIRGAFPYGYGSIYGIGRNNVFGLDKRCGILINGQRNTIDGCELQHRAFGHGIYMQSPADKTVIKNTLVEGRMRPSKDLYLETDPEDLPVRSNYKIGGRSIPKDVMYPLSEDGIRVYTKGGSVTVENCTVKKMRGGIRVYLASRATVTNSTAIDCGATNYNLPSGGKITGSSGNFAYAPLSDFRLSKSRQDIELTILPSPHAVGSHNVADILGSNHKIVFHRSEGPIDTNLRPIVVKDDNSTIRNETEYPIILESSASGNTVVSFGPVIDNGTNNKVTKLGHLANTPASNIHWPKFMAQHDLVWEEIPRQWNEGAFVGNGQVGMMIYANMEDNRLDFHMGRQDVTDHRKAPDKKTSMGVKGTDLYDYSRLDIGRMLLRPGGKILSMDVRQDLWNAEVRGTITTDLGKIRFRAFTPYTRMLNVIEISSTETKNDEPVDYQWEWKAGNPISPRIHAKPGSGGNYVQNPKPLIKTIDGVDVCEQSLLAGGDYATAWEQKDGKAQSTLYLAIANEIPDVNRSAKVAVKTVKEASSLTLAELEKEHRDWWHAYYQKSFLSIPDGRMESFFWIQIYKMAACSRADGPALDLLGPFFKNTSWPGLWWNLNVQLTYWPFNASNHLDIAENFITLIDENFDFMLAQKSGKSLGDFAWALHNYWLIYSYKGDQKAIKDKWVPKAMQIAKVYQGKQVRNKQGRIELTPMGSPEFHGFKAFPNTNYNLAILRWLLSTLIETNERANTHLKEVAVWKKTLHDLIDYPQDENGLMIGSDQPVDVSHRHYSHLLALYPLFQLNPDSPDDRDLVVKSVEHWHQIGSGKGLVGYSYTGAASLYAAFGKGNEANSVLQTFLDGNIGGGMLLANTFYMEGRGKNPVIETPLSGAASIMELLLQSWGKKIRVFPATPDAWSNASFNQLRAEGGFLVSASRRQGKTDWVAIKSLTGQPCVLKVPGWPAAIPSRDGQEIKVTKIADGEFSIDMKMGQKIMLTSTDFKGKTVIEPIPHEEAEKNRYGVKEGMNLKERMEYTVPEYSY